MKKSISSRQRQYLGNYLLNLKIQGETFHVINILWFSMKLYDKFRSFNIFSLFSAGRNYEGVKRTLQYMPHTNIRLPKSFIHCPCMTFSMEKIRSSVPYSCQRKQNFNDVMRFLCQKYYGINIKDTLKLQYIYSKTKYRLGQQVCISSQIQVCVLSKLHRYINEQQNFERKKEMCVLGAKLRKHRLLSTRN